MSYPGVNIRQQTSDSVPQQSAAPQVNYDEIEYEEVFRSRPRVIDDRQVSSPNASHAPLHAFSTPPAPLHNNRENVHIRAMTDRPPARTMKSMDSLRLAAAGGRSTQHESQPGRWTDMSFDDYISGGRGEGSIMRTDYTSRGASPTTQKPPMAGLAGAPYQRPLWNEPREPIPEQPSQSSIRIDLDSYRPGRNELQQILADAQARSRGASPAHPSPPASHPYQLPPHLTDSPQYPQNPIHPIATQPSPDRLTHTQILNLLASTQSKLQQLSHSEPSSPSRAPPTQSQRPVSAAAMHTSVFQSSTTTFEQSDRMLTREERERLLREMEERARELRGDVVKSGEYGGGGGSGEGRAVLEGRGEVGDGRLSRQDMERMLEESMRKEREVREWEARSKSPQYDSKPYQPPQYNPPVPSSTTSAWDDYQEFNARREEFDSYVESVTRAASSEAPTVRTVSPIRDVKNAAKVGKAEDGRSPLPTADNTMAIEELDTREDSVVTTSLHNPSPTQAKALLRSTSEELFFLSDHPASPPHINTSPAEDDFGEKVQRLERKVKDMRRYFKTILRIEAERYTPFIVTIQSLARGYLVRNDLAKKGIRFGKARKGLRGGGVEDEFERVRRLCKKPVGRRVGSLGGKRDRAAVRIEALWRGHRTRKVVYRYMQRRKAAVVIQSHWRGHKTRTSLGPTFRIRLLEAVRKKQSDRISSLVVDVEVLKNSVKSVLEGFERNEFLVRKLYEEVEVLRSWKGVVEKRERERAAVLIQKYWRGYLARREYALQYVINSPTSRSAPTSPGRSGKEERALKTIER
ncbi:hypothetical protein HK097_000716, partial [Rhizophlyctis rosea]